jgi:hypothetical protein
MVQGEVVLYIPFDPATVCSFRMDRVVMQPHNIPDLIEEFPVFLKSGHSLLRLLLNTYIDDNKAE